MSSNLPMYRHTLYSWPQRQPVHASFFYEKQWNWRQRLPCRTWNWRQRLPCRHLEGRDCLVQQTLQAEAAIFIFYTPLCLLCCSTSRRQRLPCGLKVHKDTCWAHSWWTLLLRFQPESCWTWSWLRVHEMKAGAAWFNALGMKGHFLLWSMCICTHMLSQIWLFVFLLTRLLHMYHFSTKKNLHSWKEHAVRQRATI